MHEVASQENISSEKKDILYLRQLLSTEALYKKH